MTNSSVLRILGVALATGVLTPRVGETQTADNYYQQAAWVIYRNTAFAESVILDRARRTTAKLEGGVRMACRISLDRPR